LAADYNDAATGENSDGDDDNKGGGREGAGGDQDQPLWRKRPRSQDKVACEAKNN
jgi:hypothetical protein